MTRFAKVLLVVVLVALGVRVAYVALAKSASCDSPAGPMPTECALGDQLFYNGAANRLAEGDGFVEPFDRSADPAPAADHPPLTAIVLAPVSWLATRPPLEWLDDPTNLLQQRYAMVLLGTALVALVGVLGRRVGGWRVGIVAAAVAALTPNIWVNDGLVMSETVAGLAVVGTLIAADDVFRRPTVRGVIVLGVVGGLAALARAELAIVVALVALALPFTTRERARTGWSYAGVAVGAALVTVAPWVAFNLARFEEPTTLSTNDGIALAGSNCDQVYWGSATGLTAITPPDPCIDIPHPPGDQSQIAKIYRERAFEYMGGHPGRVPAVVAARIARTWSAYRPLDMVTFNEGEGREPWVTRLGLVAYYPTVVAAIAGGVLLWRRGARRALWMLCAPAIAVTIGAAATYGQTRFRAAAEPSLAILAAVAAVALVDGVAARRARARRPADAGAVTARTATPRRG